MVKCPECGIEYYDNIPKCSFCGHNFKESPDKIVKSETQVPSGSKINIKSILLGALVYLTSLIFIMLMIFLSSLYYPLNSGILLLAFLIPLVAGNMLACWIGNSNYNQSILNGGIIGIIPFGIISIVVFGDFGSLAFLFIIGALGGALGKFITSKLVKNPQDDPIRKIRFTMLFIFVIVIGIFSTSTIFASSSNVTYDNNGISFKYFGDLVASNNSGNTHPFGTGNNLTVIETLNGANKTGIQSDNLVISQGNATLPLNDYINAEKTSIQGSNCTILSEMNLTVDGVPATEIDYNNTQGITGIDLLLIKNNNLYDFNFNYNGDYYNLQRFSVFLIMETSLHIK